jgi:hypothetical protein
MVSLLFLEEGQHKRKQFYKEKSSIFLHLPDVFFRDPKYLDRVRNLVFFFDACSALPPFVRANKISANSNAPED